MQESGSTYQIAPPVSHSRPVFIVVPATSLAESALVRLKASGDDGSLVEAPLAHVDRSCPTVESFEPSLADCSSVGE